MGLFSSEETRRTRYEADMHQAKVRAGERGPFNGADQEQIERRLAKDRSDRRTLGLVGGGSAGILIMAVIMAGKGDGKPSVDRLDPSITTEEVVMGGVIKAGTNVRLTPEVKNGLNDSNSCGTTDGLTAFATEVTLAKPQSAPDNEFVGFKPTDLPEAFHDCHGANGMAWVAKSQMLQINIGTNHG
jgi:hypothetical protein